MWNLLIPCAATAAGLALALLLALYLFCTLKVEIGTAQGRPGTSELGEWKKRLEELEARSSAGAIAVTPQSEPAQASQVFMRPAMNLSRRSQALRLARRGEQPEQIASRLGLPTGEVRLLLKIQGKLVEQATGGPAPDPLKSDAASADIHSSAHQAAARTVEPR